ncbi:molecular chaperone HtpG [Rhodococcus rhodnii]|uniref:Chaperone protein HtpG n=2 Tax=Rhodococcus rhodnii TaxID=38312 RepID=R7WTB1_9NOCA|nr:molecular chaperone HtpG [Rhodococcus rhodnii]EOM78507.1 heat shock protein 90 [Rhodococcus rhodnii LMG 5362]TXG91301.1 molecular chaperone HtpG [Rhodococcus rhodnii]
MSTDSQTTQSHGGPQQREFQAETRQLLDLMIHSIYSNKDTFLRELVSNASDALDKLKLEAFRDKDLDVDTSDLHVELEVDAAARTLTVRDNGIGMSRDEVVDLIGTLAKSGTAQMRSALAAAKNAETSAAAEELIGQFGIGFYSSFMVAETVTLVTRKAGEQTATRWESSGEDTYTIEEIDGAPQGTSVTLSLKPAADDELRDYTDERVLRDVVGRYSDFIAWPIRMQVERTRTVGEGDDATEETTLEAETLNSMKALWTRPRDEVTDEEYRDFYRHVSHAWDEPLEIVPMKAEGTFEYQALLFIPSVAPFDLFMQGGRTGVSLYVRRVFIMDDCEELVPSYLRFVKGVVDAADLSLNVSREILQQDRQIGAIRRRLTKKVLATVKTMQRDEPEKYRTFWTQFGRALKEGLVSDTDNRDAILAVSSFESTAGEEPTTLAQYVERMKPGQDTIYYVTGESRRQLEASPHMEAFTAKGLEVLLLTDPVDEMWVDGVPEFDGKSFRSIAKGELDLDDADSDEAKSERDERNKSFEDFLTWARGVLGETVRDVKVSTRLTSSPAVLVGDAFSMTPALERLYRASGQQVPASKRTLEVNPDHPLVAGLRAAHGERPDDDTLADTVHLLYGMAVIAEGGEPEDPAEFAKRLAGALTRAVTVGS